MPFSAESAWERTKTLTPFPIELDGYYRGILQEYELTYNTAEKAKAKGLDRCRDVYKLVHFSVLYPMSGFRRTEKGVCAKNSSRSCPQARATLADRV